MKRHQLILSWRIFNNPMACFFIFFLQISMFSQVLYSQNWQVNRIDDFYPAYTSTKETRLIRLAFDSNGNPHLIYYKDQRGNDRNKLMHAFWENGTWRKEVIDAMWARIGIAPIASSLAIDSTDQIFVIYQNVYESQRNLKFAQGKFMSWNLSFVDPIAFPNKAGDWNDSVLDKEGNLHVAYWRYINRNEYLYYARYDGQNWQKELVLSSAGRYLSIDVDKFGFPHIVVNKKGTYRSSLLYLYFDGNRWTSYTIANQKGPGIYRTYPSIKLDSNGLPNISFHDSDDGTLKFTRFNGQTWLTTVVDGGPSNRVGWWSSLVLDRRDRPVIAYYDETNGNLRLARFDGTQWRIETIESSGDVGQFSALALNQCDDPYIAYARRDRFGNEVKIAFPASYGPRPFSLIKPANGAYVKSEITFQWESSAFLGAGIENYELWIDGRLIEGNISPSTCEYIFVGNINDGVHTWRIRAVLANGGEIWSNETWSFIVDSSPPTAFALKFPENQSWVSSAQPSFQWAASADLGSGLAKYQLIVDNKLAADDIDPTQTTATPVFALIDGTHTWKVIAYDRAGNNRESEESWTLNVDQTPPAAFTLVSPENNSWYGNLPLKLIWNQTVDNGIGLLKYSLSFDGSTLIDSISVDSTSITLDANLISEGTHTWQILAYDKLLNVRQSPIRRINIDKSGPEAFSLLSPSDSSAVFIPTPEFVWQPTNDLKSGLSHYQLWIDGKLDRDNITTTKTAPAKPLIEGIHEWYVLAIDKVGNTRKSKETWHIIWDRTPPARFELLSPANGDTLLTKNPQFTWKPSNDVGSGLKRYELWINGVKNRDVPATDTSATPSTDLANGNYNWFVKAVDFAENSTPSTSIRTFTILLDTTAPVSTITHPSEGMIIGGDRFLIQGTANDGNGSGVARVEVRIDNGEWNSAVSTSDNFATWEYLWENYSEGTHVIYSRAVDKQGNMETPQSGVTITVSRARPRITSVQVNPDPAKAGEIFITINIDPSVGELDYTKSPKITFTPVNDTTNYVFQQISYQGNQWTGKAIIEQEMNNGRAVIHAEGVQNTLGNRMEPVENAGSFTIDTVPPEVAQVAVEPDTVGPGQVSLSITFSDATSGVDVSVFPEVFFKTARDSIVRAMTVGFDKNTGVWTGEAQVDSTHGDGTAIISVSGAQDLAGNVMNLMENVGSFLVDVTPPEPFSLISPPDSLWTTNRQPLLQWAPASDATTGLAYYELYLNGSLNIPFISPDVTSVQPTTPLSDADYFWYILAVDRMGNQRNSTQTRLLRIDTTPPRTAIISPAAGDTLDQTVTIRGTATDSTGVGLDSVWVSTDGGKTWYGATRTSDDFTQWEYVWTFSETGVRVLKSRGRDRLGNLETPGPGVVVQLRNYAPQISAIPDTSVLEDTRFVYRVIASDPNPMDSLRFWDNIDLFDIDSVSGVIDFVPENDAVGEHSITIYVSDGQLTDSTRFKLTVINVNDPPSSFALLEPANGTVIGTLNPTLIWEQSMDVDVGDTVRYEVILSEKSDFSDTLIVTQTYETNYKVLDGLERNKEYFWYVVARDLSGAKAESETRFSFRTSDVATGMEGKISSSIPTSFELMQNYPNPFNPETRIRFGLPEAAHVTIRIFNTLGQKIRTLVDKKFPPGYYEQIWDGRNARGEKVPSGIYLLQMRAGIFTKTRKMIVVE